MDKLGMSLEDMIKAAPPKAGKGKGGGRGSGGSGGKISGGGRGKAARAQAAPYEKPKTLSALVAEKTAAASGKGKGAGKGGLTTGTKLRVANLDFNVTADDLTELFASIGDIKTVVMEKKGVASVTYKRKADAETAISQYDGVPLDGRPLKISIVGGGLGAGAVAVVESSKGKGKGKGKGGGRGGGDDDAPTDGKGKGRGKAKGGGKGGGEKKEVSAADLDAELESYRTTAEA